MSTQDKILTKDALGKKVATWKAEGQTIVFTNGCFDILHPGHIDYMEKARNLGDKLIVGVNTDASVRRLKGKERPINSEQTRGILLAALAFVDAVVFFDEDTPYTLIESILPHILVKGNDYLISNIVGADIVLRNGGKVATIELVEGFSTTQLIEKIKTLN